MWCPLFTSFPTLLINKRTLKEYKIKKKLFFFFALTNMLPSAQVLLQLACGAFALDSALCEAINVPMDKLKWTSPFSSHRTSLGHLSHSSARRPDSADDGYRPPFEPEMYQPAAEQAVGIHSSLLSSRNIWSDMGSSFLPSEPSAVDPPPSQVDAAWASRSGALETSPGAMLKRIMDPESMVWATAVALAWLEHSSASYFIEWELVAAKASMWLSAQEIPEGKDLASIKSAANQLFIILRHWDENLQLNMLCYNPNSVWGRSWQRPLQVLSPSPYYANKAVPYLHTSSCSRVWFSSLQLCIMCILLCLCAPNISQTLQRHFDWAGARNNNWVSISRGWGWFRFMPQTYD